MRGWKILGILVIVGILTPWIAAISSVAIPSTCYVGVSWKENYPPPWNNCDKAQEDADGFLYTLMTDPHWQMIFRITENNNHAYQWEYTQDQNYVEKAHFAYYAGHGYYQPSTGRAWMVFYWDLIHGIYDSPRIYPDYCDWGDEGPLKWVALACCDVGHRTYKALDGVHLICAAKCEIGEFEYGKYFAQRLLANLTIKQAWFDTMLQAYNADPTNVKGKVNVVGEDSSVGNDHIYWHGYVAPDPPVDDYYYEWTYTPSSGSYGEGGGHK